MPPGRSRACFRDKQKRNFHARDTPLHLLIAARSLVRVRSKDELIHVIEAKSRSVDLMDGLSRQSTELKVSMQAETAKSVRDRASQIAESSGCRRGNVQAAKMFVPQITSLHTAENSKIGNIDDTSSLEKNITAVVSVDYSIR